MQDQKPPWAGADALTQGSSPEAGAKVTARARSNMRGVTNGWDG